MSTAESAHPGHRPLRAVGVGLGHDGGDAALAHAGRGVEAETEYRLLAENASDVVARLDLAGRIEWISPSVESVTGWAPAHLVGMPLRGLVHPDDLGAIAATQHAMARDGAADGEARIRLADDTHRWFGFTLSSVCDVDGAPFAVIGSARDIQSEVAARHALQESEERFRLAWLNAAGGMAIVAQDGRFLQANPALCRMLGRADAELLASSWQELTHPDDLREDLGLVDDLIAGRRDSYRLLKRYLRPDGQLVWGDLSVAAVRRSDGSLRHFISQIIDVTAQHEANERLDYLARSDLLTGLLSRASITSLLEEALAGAGSSRTRVGLMFTDLHQLRLVNDSLGHAAGDALLQVVAARLSRAVRTDCHVGRFGGDHFVVVVPDVTDETSLERIAERIIRVVGAEVVIDGHSLVPAVSIGIATSTGGKTAQEMMRDVEAAMTGAQHAGRNRWQFFDPGMHERAMTRLRIEQELRTAVDGRQFVVHYQPLVSMRGRALVGHEALVRWQHPERGLLLPADFLPVAEESGLIVEIGQQVLETVCLRIADDPGVGRISVNQSAVQLSVPGWHEAFLDTVERAGVDAHRVVLEVTETAVMPVMDQVRDDLAALRAQGIGVHIDDFGTGFSSLSMLRDLPVTGLKLDMSFVHSLTEHASYANALAAGVASLANGLGVETIAEGIETETQAALLLGQGWRFGQGWLFGRPGPFPG